MANLLADTDVFIDHLRGARRFSVGDDDRVFYSVITRCELFAGRSGDERNVEVLLSPFTELIVSREIAERAGRIRRETAVRTPDALIAAAAIEHGLQLLTRNLRDFARVPGLEVLTPA